MRASVVVRALAGSALLGGLLANTGLGCAASAGQAASPGVQKPRFDDAPCRELASPEKARCRVKLANAILGARRDPIGVACVRDHAAQIEKLERNVAGGSVSTARAEDARARLSSDLDLCFGEDE